MNAGLLCDLSNVCNAIRLTDCRGKIIIIIIIIIILILVFILILIQVIIILILKPISNAILLNNPPQTPDLSPPYHPDHPRYHNHPLLLIIIVILIKVLLTIILKAISNAILLNHPLQRPDLQLVSALLSSLMGALL